MSVQQVTAYVQRKDWSILDFPGAIGPDASPALAVLLDDRDAGVRELALTCLNAAGGPAARTGMFKALRDRQDTVRASACRSAPLSHGWK